MDTPTILPILKKIPLFADLNEETHKQIVQNIVMNYYPASHVFFTEGTSSPEGSMYIIKHGEVKILRTDMWKNEQVVAVLKDNDFFGEMALVLNEPRNATANAVTDCEVFELKKADFLKLMQTSPTMAKAISSEFIDRLKENNKLT